MDERLTIGDLASATGTKVVTVRYYEQAGLLPAPPRTSGNYRTYGADHLNRLRFIRRCRDLIKCGICCACPRTRTSLVPR
jgi:DNA-binding transcriptional MerR regulator